MRFLRLEIQGFRSFQELQTLDLAALKPGLYHVTGENLVEPELEGNAVGKSSLFDAFNWLLFDRTSRGLRAGNVKSWKSTEQCGGILTLDAGHGLLSVFRSWSPNALEIVEQGGKEEPRPIGQEELEALVGMSADAFQAAIYFAQFSPTFADLKPGPQMELFTSILRLGFWERAAERARDSANASEVDIANLRDKLARVEGQAEELLAIDYAAKAEAWEADRAKRLAGAKRALKPLEADLAAAGKALVAAHKGAQAFLAARDKETAQAGVLASLAADWRRLEADLAKLKAKNLKNCPTCGQPVNNDHIRAEVKRVQELMLAKTDEIDRAEEKHTALARDMAKSRDAAGRHIEAEREQARLESAIGTTQAAIQRVADEVNPFDEQVTEAELRAEVLLAQGGELEAAIADGEKNKAGAAYWVKGFREVRLMLIRESLAQLTVEANEVLFQLGLHDWSVDFDVEKETKAGGINKGFTVMVNAPHSDGPVPWEAWSGGESQRLRVGIAMGFSNLVCARLGVAPNVEFWDEPSSWLPRGGIKDLLAVLAERASRMGKVILLADHRVFDFGGFAGRISVVKDKDGSHLSVAV